MSLKRFQNLLSSVSENSGARDKDRQQSGFTLVEILIVVLIISVLATVAVIGAIAVLRGQRQQAAKARVLLVGEAQMRYRTALGRGRYGSLCAELVQVKSGGLPLIQPSTAAYDNNNCTTPTTIGEWQIYSAEDSTVDTSYLKSRFSVYARRAGETVPTFCLFEDRVLRQGSSSDCTRTSAPVE